MLRRLRTCATLLIICAFALTSLSVAGCGGSGGGGPAQGVIIQNDGSNFASIIRVEIGVLVDVGVNIPPGFQGPLIGLPSGLHSLNCTFVGGFTQFAPSSFSLAPGEIKVVNVID